MFLDFLALRLILEPEMAAQAAINATEEDKKRMLDQCAVIENLVNTGLDSSNADSLLHYYIATASGNRAIGSVMPLISNAILTGNKITNEDCKHDSLLFHRTIVNSICQGDEQGARYAMISHLTQSRMHIKDALSKMSDI